MLGLWASKKSNRRASTATESRSWLNNVRAHERAKKGIDAALRVRGVEPLEGSDAWVVKHGTTHCETTS